MHDATTRMILQTDMCRHDPSQFLTVLLSDTHPLLQWSYLFYFLISLLSLFFFFFNDTATTEIYTLSLHDALPIYTGNAEDHRDGLAHTTLRVIRIERRADEDAYVEGQSHDQQHAERARHETAAEIGRAHV